jgi:large subunit ribosomal protein L22
MAVATAKLSNLQISARKVRLVADLVRGQRIQDARDTLQFTIKDSAKPLLKLLESAVANAENAAQEGHEDVDTDEMIIEHIVVNEGRTLQRYQPAPRGRASRIRKRSSHVEIRIADK